ncbi:MAG: integrase core domain-containing protein [Bryobacteraceae bacterium]
MTKTHSRPYASDDNPHSETQFRTTKYRPDFPDRFGSVQDSRAFGHRFFPWYNDDHRHASLGLMPPPGWSTMIWLRRRASNASASSMRPTRPTPNDSSANRRKHPHCNRRSGSTNRHSQRKKDTKLHGLMAWCLKVVDTRRRRAARREEGES